MSTFNGIVKEFPQIQFDYFRKVDGQPPSLANFLSHIHSDHLSGLAGKSYRAPFIYCSAGTKKLLLKLERRVHRLNYAKRLVESHEYSYLDFTKRERILRELPLETPTEIELCPGYTIRVTLFDANHCPGSTMFLVEGNGKAILYTGDIRAEPWWLEKLKRNPILLPYFRGIKILDFQRHADGIAELLTQVSRYPQDTIFHLNTWTTGYEDAWVALAAQFNAQIHLDDYRLRLYSAIGKKEEWEHGPYLFGHSLNDKILTDDCSAKFHSCEKWLDCEVRDRARREGKLVEISPLVAKYRDAGGVEYLLREPGEAGGNIDANAVDEISAELLIELAATMRDHGLQALISQADIRPGSSLPLVAPAPEPNMTIEKFLQVLRENVEALLLARQQEQVKTESKSREQEPAIRPTWFGFACSRHSSFSELQELVKSFGPHDIYPCVAAEGSWYQKDSIRKLFGKLCRGDTFAFDIERDLDRENYGERHEDIEERRAAGMEEESQQARSQQLNSSQNSCFGETVVDDTVLRRRAARDDGIPAPTYPHGETQLDPYDPSILAKVEKAVEEGRELSKSVLGSESRSRSRSQDVYKPKFTSSARRQEPPPAMMQKQRGTAQRPLRYSEMSTTASTMSSGRQLMLDDSSEIDGSQDSLGDQSFGELDRDEIRDVMRAVQQGEWQDRTPSVINLRRQPTYHLPTHPSITIDMAPPKSGKSKPGRSAIADVVTREYTIHMHKRVHGVSFKKRAPKAIKEIKEFAHKQMGTTDVRLDPQLNKEVWKQGIKGVPYRLRVRISRKRNDEENAKEKLYSFVEAVNVKNPKGLQTTVIDA
ncbi:hypothetical protein DRE_01527 [Drechslerella stenobrocha 248]|uniref:Uncharacterized protein n=1 Tax=Drechslerella stenobrocha 248 TaxID=1043628 RepID=W7I4H9_9PEZI|nr:hypothetical protein DRE_01527 [Drechslerella stenobrocha 248]